MQGSDVHAKAREVLGFWYALTPEQHFAKSDRLDQEIARRFGALRDAVLASKAEGWRGDPETLLAAIIVLDQFSRNIHRGSAEAFAADALAQELTLEALDKGWDGGMTGEQKQFLYMPLMHAEDAALQDLCIDKFEALGDKQSLDFAHQHAGAIIRFGRFPSRNAALGRESTELEKEYLALPDAGW
ncbi:MAG: DUF924 domain-containing protein [Sphingomonadales bacterium]|nr:MAG: DUF924 domain-containing protein [Sphingomonadales bacterium]